MRLRGGFERDLLHEKVILIVTIEVALGCDTLDVISSLSFLLLAMVFALIIAFRCYENR